MSEADNKTVISLTDIDVTVLGKLEVAFQNDYSISSACRYAGISRETYYRWLRDVEGFSDRMEAAQEKLLDVTGEIINQYIADKDVPLSEKVRVALKFKEKRDPRYKNTVAVEPVGKDDFNERVKDFLDDPDTRPEHLQDDSTEADAEDRAEA
jgi:hypothetical protein